MRKKGELKKVFKREIIFVKTPLTGFYRYKDLFQIFPANLIDMPKSKGARHYPVILEYWYTAEELDAVNVGNELEGLEDLVKLTSVSYNKTEHIISLFSIITTNLFFKYNSRDSRWGFPIVKEPTEGEANFWSSKWCLEWFHWPGLPDQLIISNFTQLDSNPAANVDWKKCFFYNPNYDWFDDKEISFPNITDYFLDCYFKKDLATRKTIDSAIASSNAAMEFMHTRKKISLLSAFTAIETMVNLENNKFKSTKCESCGQEIFKVSAKYRDFLLKYIGDSKENKKKFSTYYSLRSKVVHTGQDFKTEKLFSDVDNEVQQKEQLELAEIVVLSKIAIIMWTIKTSEL